MSALEDQINAVEEEWGCAAIAADETLLHRLIAEDAIMFHGSGVVEEKQNFLSNLFRRLEIRSVVRTEIRIRQLAPTVAVASCVQEQQVRHRDTNSAFQTALANISRVWVLRDGRWQMASYHATRLPPAG